MVIEKSSPTGRYARVIWWLYEQFTRTRLDLPDLERGSYFDLLDEDIYVAGSVTKMKRQRINVNLLGTLEFSPMVRKKGLGAWSEEALKARCEEIAGEYPPEIFQRAVRYLYAKESKSSHEIERETPDHKRAEKFIGLLEQAWHRSFLEKDALIELQRTHSPFPATPCSGPERLRPGGDHSSRVRSDSQPTARI